MRVCGRWTWRIVPLTRRCEKMFCRLILRIVCGRWRLLKSDARSWPERSSRRSFSRVWSWQRDFSLRMRRAWPSSLRMAWTRLCPRQRSWRAGTAPADCFQKAAGESQPWPHKTGSYCSAFFYAPTIGCSSNHAGGHRSPTLEAERGHTSTVSRDQAILREMRGREPLEAHLSLRLLVLRQS